MCYECIHWFYFNTDMAFIESVTWSFLKKNHKSKISRNQEVGWVFHWFMIAWILSEIYWKSISCLYKSVCVCVCAHLPNIIDQISSQRHNVLIENSACFWLRLTLGLGLSVDRALISYNNHCQWKSVQKDRKTCVCACARTYCTTHHVLWFCLLDDKIAPHYTPYFTPH